MLSADNKKKLKCALEFSADDPKCKRNLHWGQCLKDNRLIKDLYLKGFGSIPVPISCQNVSNIFGGAASNNAATDKTSNQAKIECPNETSSLNSQLRISISSNTKCSILDQAVLAVNKITGVDLSEEIKIRLNQLTLCTVERQYYKKTLNPKKPGILFGKFILQTPVEGGHEGGILQVGNSSEEAFYDFHSESDRLFYAAALLANCEHHWQPIERGNVVLLEFDLLWQPESALTISDLPLSSFLAASKLAEEALLTWKVNCQKIEEIEEGEIVSDIVATGSSGVSAPLSQDYAVPGCAKEEAPADVSKDHLLIIPLVETYFETNFSFSSLRGRDRQMAHILQSVDFIDVHLAIVNQNLEKSVNLESRHWEVKEGFVQKSRSFQVAQWIYSNTSVPQFQRYNLELTNQLLGDVKTVLRSDGNSERMCRHPVLIIQPRHQSVRRCCTFQFDAILHHIEFRIPIDVNSKLMRRQSLACLGQILDYCQAEPFRVWDIPDAEISRRNRRLLKICQELQAQKEGLRLMALLCQGIYSSLQETKGCTAVFTLSVRNEIEARSIIEMVLNAGGWHVFASSVCELIIPSRMNQLKGFATLVTTLLEHHCLQGALDVTKRIFSTISQDFFTIQRLEQSQIDAYVDAVCALDAHLDREESVLMPFLIPVFTELTFHQQCRLLIDLQKENFSRLKGSPSTSQIFYEKLCLISLRRGLFSSGPILEIAGQVVDCFVKLGEKEILKMFIGHVLWGKDNASKELNHPAWLQELFSFAKLSALVKETLAESVKVKMDIMMVIAVEPLPVSEDFLRGELIHFVFALLRLDKYFQYGDTVQMKKFEVVFQNMPHHRLVSLVYDLIARGNSGLSAMPYTGVWLLKRECQATQENVTYQAIVDMLKYSLKGLTTIGLSVADLLMATLLHPHCNRWNPFDKNLLTRLILLTPEIWTANKFLLWWTSLLSSWITRLIETIDVQTPAIVYVKSDITDCFLTYVRAEKMHHSFGHNGLFLPLFAKMSMPLLANFIWDIYQACLKDQKCVKKPAQPILSLYCDLWRHFLVRNDDSSWSATATEDGLLQMIECVLWLSDDSSVTLLAKQISDLYPEETNEVISYVLKSESIGGLIAASPDARNSLCVLLEYRVAFAKEAKLKKLPNKSEFWKMPSVSLPQHPNVEEFLHSSTKKMIYSNFKNRTQAKELENLLLSFGSVDGYSLRTEITGSGFSTICNIQKIRCFNTQELKQEAANLTKIICSLKQPKPITGFPLQPQSGSAGTSGKRTNTDPWKVGSPTKKLKWDLTDVLCNPFSLR